MRGVRRMLALFGALAIAGVILLAFSVVLGLVVLVVAEVFFMLAYRRFSQRPDEPGRGSR
jgi:membrane protein implicated in regulation of membrane protease activity